MNLSIDIPSHVIAAALKHEQLIGTDYVDHHELWVGELADARRRLSMHIAARIVEAQQQENSHAPSSD